MGHLIKKLFIALGGLLLWIWALLMNSCMHKNNKTEIGFYLFEDFEIKKNTGFSSEGLRFVLGIFVFIVTIIALDHFN